VVENNKNGSINFAGFDAIINAHKTKKAGPLCPIGKINDASGGESNEREFFLPSARFKILSKYIPSLQKRL
jgi:hypothetical protein